MSRETEAGAAPTDCSAPAHTPRPVLPAWALLPLALLAAAVVAALLAWQWAMPAWLTGLAMLLSSAGALLSGALWGRQRQQNQLRDARLEQQLLGQMLDQWTWQTDTEHRLTRLQPPLGAPATSWVGAAGTAQTLWQRFDDAELSLQARMAAGAALSDLPVWQGQGQARQPWRLQGRPRFDHQGRFVGYLGLVRPMAAEQRLALSEQALSCLLQQGPAALCLALQPTADGPWLLHAASPQALGLLGQGAALTGPMPWQQAMAGLPEGLAEPVLALAPGQACTGQGLQARLLALGHDSQGLARRLLVLAAEPSATAPDASAVAANQALAEEHAAFTYTVSHDLRAPLRVVEGFGRILKEDHGPSLDRVGNDHLDRLMAAAVRMNHMIDALLSLSRLSTQPLAHHPVNLSTLAQHVVDELQQQSPARQVEVQISPDLRANGDPTLLRMALENLLGNAWKYSAKAAHARIQFQTVVQDGRTVFVVRDNGAGFDMRFAERLFGMFQRLHGSTEFAGHGVGLASVRRIVRRHGGEIWAEAAVGQGASFYFTLKG